MNFAVMIAKLCPCFASKLKVWELERAREVEREQLRIGITCSRKSSMFGFGSRNTSVKVRLSPDSDGVLMWQKETEESDAVNSWYEIDMMDIKNIELRGNLGFALISKRGDLLLELEISDTITCSAWVNALAHLIEDIKLKPNESSAQQSLIDRAKEAASKQKYYIQRSIELQQRKTEADIRKNKYIEEAGGLKYTAIAMLNR